MLDPVTEQQLRLRRMRAPSPAPAAEPARRTSLVCAVCGREVRPEEEFFFVDQEVHCFQCQDMLSYELKKERELESQAKQSGTKWVEDKGED